MACLSLLFIGDLVCPSRLVCFQPRPPPLFMFSMVPISIYHHAVLSALLRKHSNSTHHKTSPATLEAEQKFGVSDCKVFRNAGKNNSPLTSSKPKLPNNWCVLQGTVACCTPLPDVAILMAVVCFAHLLSALHQACFWNLLVQRAGAQHRAMTSPRPQWDSRSVCTLKPSELG